MPIRRSIKPCFIWFAESTKREGLFQVRRRSLLKQLGAASLQPFLGALVPGETAATAATARIVRRVRPSDPAWPTAASWDKLNEDVGGQLIKLESPLAPCYAAPDAPACQVIFKNLS